MANRDPIAKRLQDVGFEERQADELVNCFGSRSLDHLATKADLAEVKTELKGDVAEVKTDLAVVKTDVANLKTGLAEVKTDVAEVKANVTNLKTGLANAKTELSDKISGSEVKLVMWMVGLFTAALTIAAFIFD